MYSVVMVVAMAGAPEAPADCCLKQGWCNFKDKCGNWGNKCCSKNYGCAKNDCAPAPCAPAPAPVVKAPAPAPAPAPCATTSCDSGSKGCCFNFCGKFKNCFSGWCNKGNSCNTGCATTSSCGSSSKCCFGGCFSGCCSKGSYSTSSGCGTTVVPPAEAPKKEMPKAGKIGG